jgi:hypothetical protein
LTPAFSTNNNKEHIINNEERQTTNTTQERRGRNSPQHLQLTTKNAARTKNRSDEELALEPRILNQHKTNKDVALSSPTFSINNNLQKQTTNHKQQTHNNNNDKLCHSTPALNTQHIPKNREQKQTHNKQEHEQEQ